MIASSIPPEIQIYESVPMVHVADVEESVRFYGNLGFACDTRYKANDGTTNWASVRCGSARLFFARADGPITASQQAVLFYMYSKNVVALREHLLAQGLGDAAAQPMPNDERDFSGEPQTSVVFEINRPFYMPDGQLRVHDPDGYCILVGQLGD